MGFLGLSRPSRVGGWAWLLFCGVAVLVGGVGSFFLLVRPTAEIVAARLWNEVPATFESAGVESFRTGKRGRGRAYRVNVQYAYDAGGQGRVGTQLRIGRPPRTRDRGAAHDTVDALRVNPPAVCYVDPDDPTRSVLDRGPHAGLLAGLPFAALLLSGLGGTLVVLTRMRRPRDGAIYWTPHLARWVALPVSVGLAAFASTFALALGFDELAGWARFNGLFALVPAGFGVVLLANLGYALLGLLNPHPQLWLTNRRLVEGRPTDFEVALVGGLRRVRRLVVRLEGRRHTIERDGRRYSVESEIIHDQTLIDLPAGEDGLPVARGRIVVPPGSRPRYGPVHSEDTWWLVFDGEVIAGPDVRDELELLLDFGPRVPRRPRSRLAQIAQSYGGLPRRRRG